MKVNSIKMHNKHDKMWLKGLQVVYHVRLSVMDEIWPTDKHNQFKDLYVTHINQKVMFWWRHAHLSKAEKDYLEEHYHIHIYASYLCT